MQVGKHFFNDKLSMLCMGWLGDEVYSIRRAAAENLLKLTELFGEEWTKEIVLPRLEILHSNSNYLHRVTSLYGMQVLCKVIAPSVRYVTYSLTHSLTYLLTYLLIKVIKLFYHYYWL
jgi:serine/threonine-protein phosphatase 2A regulatory subunit A